MRNATMLAGAFGSLSLGSAVFAQDGDVAIMDHVLVDDWRGELWQKGGKFRCTTGQHVMIDGRVRRDADDAACARTIECYRAYEQRIAKGKMPRPTRWTQVNTDRAVSIVQGECAFPRSVG